MERKQAAGASGQGGYHRRMAIRRHPGGHHRRGGAGRVQAGGLHHRGHQLRGHGAQRTGRHDQNGAGFHPEGRNTHALCVHLVVQAGLHRRGSPARNVAEGQPQSGKDCHLRNLPAGRGQDGNCPGEPQRHSGQALRHSHGGVHVLLHL